MAFSIIQTTATGATNAFPINFTLGFNNRNEVTCQVNDEVDGLGDPVYRALDWVNDGLVNVLPATLIPASTKVVFKRTINKTALAHDYANGEAIDEINLDESNKQNLMAIHELFDGRFTSALQQDLDMGTHKITNLVPGSNPTDAVTFGQLNGLSGGAGNGLFLDVGGTQVQDDSLLWDTTAMKFIRRSITYLKTQLGISAFGSSLISSANALAARITLGISGISSTAETTTVGASIALAEGTNNGTNTLSLKAADSLPANIVLVGTVGGNVVTESGTQTLSGKTMDFGSNTFSGFPYFTNVVQQRFTASGTYTPTAGMKYCIVEAVGGGGGGGGGNASGCGAGGGSGGYSRSRFDAAAIGASKAVVIGAAGTGGAVATNGTAGGTTTLGGTLLTAIGGPLGFGTAGSNAAGSDTAAAGTGGLAVGGSAGTAGSLMGGNGGNSFFGGGGGAGAAGAAGKPAAANTGGGGGGGSGPSAGGAGAAGLMVITEYI
jgi:hypothetical protein